MNILGIYDDHNCSAAFMSNGKIVEAVSEERFSELKNDSGFPKKSVDYIFNKYNLSNSNLDLVGYCGKEFPDAKQYLYKHFTFSTIEQHIDYMEEYWKKILNNVPHDDNFIKEKYYNNELLDKFPSYYRNEAKILNIDNLDTYNHKDVIYSLFERNYSISKNKIKFVDHHLCHLSHAYESWSKKNLFDTIGVTLDSWGDGRNQTVWKISKSNYELLADSNECELARIYRFITLYLGMMPVQHEYKLMGLAPYAKKEHSKEVTEILNNIIKLENLKFKHHNRPNDLYSFLSEKLKYYRFDNIARGAQEFIEENVVKLFKNIYEQTGINTFVYSGGLAMNVKANKLLHEQKFVKDLFIPASPDDPGTCIGACYELAKQNNIKSYAIKNYYLGPAIKDNDSKKIIYDNKKINSTNYAIKEDVSIDEIVDLLTKGKIVGRASDAMEFGARALGNRSIFANPGFDGIVKKINETIKNRDFWMPFAGTVCEELSGHCLRNPKKIDGSFMTISYDSIGEVHKFRSATHQYDNTIRAQILYKEQNPWYYELIMKFFEKTQIPLLLNTSLNVHGKPIVRNASQAIELFENTSLENIIIGNTLLSKKI